MNFGWNDPIPSDLIEIFRHWSLTIPTLVGLKVPRWIGLPALASDAQREFHVFCDVRTVGIGAACYARFEDSNQLTHVSLVMAKSHVIPSNQKTSGLHGSIPRAELEGAMKVRDIALDACQAYKVPIGDFTF